MTCRPLDQEEPSAAEFTRKESVQGADTVTGLDAAVFALFVSSYDEVAPVV
ncbi:hypothetical protein HEK616_84420 (plasmid) [Streptomyces nigrescens]|uniref:Uncharacterized protein n=1 Tax=Streptomyces nigrescens TaxID=1920 RepID=A0ABM8A8U5_STRNI|nr:hypothetical protein HEK616_84420 [Streptomyces nigrescens]